MLIHLGNKNNGIENHQFLRVLQKENKMRIFEHLIFWTVNLLLFQWTEIYYYSYVKIHLT